MATLATLPFIRSASGIQSAVWAGKPAAVRFLVHDYAPETSLYEGHDRFISVTGRGPLSTQVAQNLMLSFSRYTDLFVEAMPQNGNGARHVDGTLLGTFHIVDGTKEYVDRLGHSVACHEAQRSRLGAVIGIIPDEWDQRRAEDWNTVIREYGMEEYATAVIQPGTGPTNHLPMAPNQVRIWSAIHALMEMTLLNSLGVDEELLARSYANPNVQLQAHTIRDFLPTQQHRQVTRRTWRPPDRQRVVIGHYWLSTPEMSSPIVDGYHASFRKRLGPPKGLDFLWHMRDFCQALGMTTDHQPVSAFDYLEQAFDRNISLKTGPVFLDDRPRNGFGTIFTAKCGQSG